MKSTHFFTSDGKFHRGNLHTHSTNSDGVLAPEEVCRRYQAEGYDFISLTDHLVGLYEYPISDTTPYRNENFTTILGAELHSGALEKGNIWHILAVGLPSDFSRPNVPDFFSVEGSESGAQIAERARDAGAFVTIVHPHWSSISEADALSINAAHAVEVYNHGCAIGNDRGEGFLTLEHLLNEGRQLNMIAADDAHFHLDDSFGGWVMVKATENNPEALLAALIAGEYYSSQGPEIYDIRIGKDKKNIDVDCSEAKTILVQGQGTAMANLHGDAMTTAHLSLSCLSKSEWIRVTVIDRNGKRAWSNPIWLTQ
jgi:hypothetical protein